MDRTPRGARRILTRGEDYADFEELSGVQEDEPDSGEAFAGHGAVWRVQGGAAADGGADRGGAGGV